MKRSENTLILNTTAAWVVQVAVVALLVGYALVFLFGALKVPALGILSGVVGTFSYMLMAAYALLPFALLATVVTFLVHGRLQPDSDDLEQVVSRHPLLFKGSYWLSYATALAVAALAISVTFA